MNSWIKKEKEKDKDREKDREIPRTKWRKNDDGRNRNKSEFTEVRAKSASGVASVVVGGMNVDKFYEDMKKSSFSWLENSLI